MKNTGQLVADIMNTVRQSPESKPAEIVKKVTQNSEEAKNARDAIRSLVEKGDLHVTLDWKVRAGK